MSRFYVGQRVKVVADFYPGCGGLPVGHEGVITGGFDSYACNDGTEMLGYELDLDFICAEGEIEPILPEGATPSEFATLAELLESLEAVSA